MVLLNNGNAWEESKQTWLLRTVDGGTDSEITLIINRFFARLLQTVFAPDAEGVDDGQKRFAVIG